MFLSYRVGISTFRFPTAHPLYTLRMVKYKIIDNFLSDSDFTELTNNILPSVDENSNINNFTWKYLKNHVRKDFDESEIDKLIEDPDESFKKVTDIEVLKPIHDWFFTNILHIGMKKL